MTDHAPSGARRAMKAGWATPDDWERSREVIKRLYLDQNKSLKEVMTIMNRDYALHATVKMYKSRIGQWGLEKKNKASDMEFVLRKKMHRDAIHKRTTFTVRGRPLNMQAFSIYVKRHHLLEQTGMAAYMVDTPEHISYQTPATSPHPPAEINELINAPADGRLEQLQDDAHLSECNLDRPTVLGDGIDRRVTQAALPVSEVQDLYRWLFLKPSMARTIALPESMCIPERLFLLIPTYVAGALSKGIWALDADGCLVGTTVIDEIHSGAAVQFMEYVTDATEVLDQRLLVEARQALEEAFALMPSMIRYDSPFALQKYLNAVMYMTAKGFPELADMLRRHMKDVAALVIPPQNPVSQIYAVMSEVDPEQLDNVLEKALECRYDSLARNLAPFSFDVIEANIDSVLQLHWTSLTEAENRLRILLFECEQHGEFASPCTMSVISALIVSLLRQRRVVEAEAMSNDMHDRARRSRSLVYEIIARQHLAEIQHASGRLQAACLNLNAAMEMVKRRHGRKNPWRTRYLLKLENWLREGDMGQEADAIRLQYDEIISESGP